jgi:basic amino acid/polyamine antiporter, APA family
MSGQKTIFQRFMKRATTSSTSSTTSTRTHSTKSLVRSLGKFDVTLVGVGASIGAGIFVVSGEAAKIAGPAVVLSFFVAAIVCVLNALCYAEMSSRIPISGSAYIYSQKIFGEFAAVITGLNLMFDYHIGAALIARNLVHYLIKLINVITGSTLPSWLNSITWASVPFFSISFTSPLLLIILAVILCGGVKESANVNNMMTILKITIVLVVIFAGITKVDTNNWVPFTPKGPSSIFQASSLVFFAYIGFDAVCNTAEECIEPEKTLPFGIVMSLLICSLLYAGVTLVLTGLLPFDQLPVDASLSAAFEKTKGMEWILVIIDIGAVIGLTTTLFLGLYSQSRMYLAIARDNLLPPHFSTVHRQSKVPRNATMLCTIIACILAAFFDVEKLSSFLDMGILLAYSVVCACVLVVRAGGGSEDVQCDVSSSSSNDSDGGNIRHSFDEDDRRNIEDKKNNIQKCYHAILTLFLVFLLPGIAATNKWNVQPVVLWFYVIIGVLLCIIMVSRVNFNIHSLSPPSSDIFLCPIVPWIPSIGLCSNSYLMTQRPWEGWLRLLVITLLVSILYATMIILHDEKDEGEQEEEQEEGSSTFGSENDVSSKIPLLNSIQ